MKHTSFLPATLLGTSLTLLAASPVQAMTIRQTQEMSLSTKVTTDNGSSSDTTSEASAWGKQSQRVEIDDSPSYSYRPMRGGHMGYHPRRSAWSRTSTHRAW